MKLRRRLIEVRLAKQRVLTARRRTARCLCRWRRHAQARPLTTLGVAGAGGCLAGWIAGRRGKSAWTLWNDPALRWLWRQLTSVADP